MIQDCPNCGKPAREIYTRHGLLEKCDDCDLWGWEGRPLVDASTHNARKLAHFAFDFVWQKKLETRSAAYGKLAEHLGMTRSACHMRFMTREQALSVVEAVTAIWGSKAEMWRRIEQMGHWPMQMHVKPREWWVFHRRRFSRSRSERAWYVYTLDDGGMGV